MFGSPTAQTPPAVEVGDALDAEESLQIVAVERGSGDCRAWCAVDQVRDAGLFQGPVKVTASALPWPKRRGVSVSLNSPTRPLPG